MASFPLMPIGLDSYNPRSNRTSTGAYGTDAFSMFNRLQVVKSWLRFVMAKASDDKPVKRHLNIAEKRARKAAEIRIFLDAYKRPSQTRQGMDPNDRRYKRDGVDEVRRMSPEELDRLMRDDED